jgi:hypothetical protein
MLRVRRPFYLSDLMALIATIAIAYWYWYLHLRLGAKPPPQQMLGKVDGWLEFGWVVGLAFAFLLFGLRLRAPRPCISRLSRQPGFVASFTVVAVWITMFLNELVRYRKDIFLQDPAMLAICVGNAAWCESTASAIVAAWALLAMSSRWRHEKGWIDSAGLLLGVFWLMLCICDNLH